MHGIGSLNLNKRISPKFSPLPDPVTHMDDLALPVQTSVHPHSFGKDFNLIRAVEEYGPQRIQTIQRDLADLALRQQRLTTELATLERLVAVAKSDQDTGD